MAHYFVLIDGLPDEPALGLRGQTPLQAAHCPVLKKMKARGSRGLFATCPPGFVTESMTCIMTLLGVQPQYLPKGRAYLEALANGIPVLADDLVLRCNLVTLENGKVVSSFAQGLSTKQMTGAIAHLQGLGALKPLRLVHLQQYKNLLFVRGGKQAGEQLHTLPPHENLHRPATAFLPYGGALGAGLAEFTQQCQAALAQYFAGLPQQYMLVPWGQACYQPAPSFEQLFGCGGAVVCGTEIVRGIGKAMGLAVPQVPGATADVDTDLNSKAKAALTCGEQYSFVMVHLNGADEAGHRQNPIQKKEFLEHLDQELLAPLEHGLKPGERLLVCSDHGTSSTTGKHLPGLQPFLLYEKTERQPIDFGSLPGWAAVPLLLTGFIEKQGDATW